MTRLEALQARQAALQAEADTQRNELSDLLLVQNLDAAQRSRMEVLTEARTANSTMLSAVAAQVTEEQAAEARTAQVAQVAADAGTAPNGTQRGVGGAVVNREERTYTALKALRGETNIFADAFNAQFSSDYRAQERIQRHMREVVVEKEAPTVRDNEAPIEARATTTASFAGLVVPQYLTDMFALLLRNGRPTANVVNRMPLPEQGMSLIIPRGTTGASAASQATENSALSSTDEVWANLTVPVVTIGGQQDVSRQSMERGTPGIDTIVFMDLVKAFNAEADRQVLNGSGASGQMLGILNTSGINFNTPYGAVLTPTNFALKTAGGLAAIAGAGTAVSPTVQIMHPRRWYWLIGQVDSQGRPLAIPNVQGPMNALAINLLPGGYSGDGGDQAAKIVGWFQGLPVILDANMPINLTNGGTADEDAVIQMDGTEAFLWEDNGGIPRQFRFEQTLAPNLTIKLVLFNYLAFTAGRYPVAFSQVGGRETAGSVNGQIAPAF